MHSNVKNAQTHTSPAVTKITTLYRWACTCTTLIPNQQYCFRARYIDIHAISRFRNSDLRTQDAVDQMATKIGNVWVTEYYRDTTWINKCLGRCDRICVSRSRGCCVTVSVLPDPHRDGYQANSYYGFGV